MITEDQQKWIDHLSDTDKIKIFPYNPASKDVFLKVKSEMEKVLGGAEILHRGSTSMGISGQGELDIYIPVAEKDFDEYVGKMLAYFGKARSIYLLRRAAFVKFVDGIKAEIFIINKETPDWTNLLNFEGYLKKNPDALKRYENLKGGGEGLSVREYYRRKTEFLNEILSRCSEAV